MFQFEVAHGCFISSVMKILNVVQAKTFLFDITYSAGYDYGVDAGGLIIRVRPFRVLSAAQKSRFESFLDEMESLRDLGKSPKGVLKMSHCAFSCSPSRLVFEFAPCDLNEFVSYMDLINQI